MALSRGTLKKIRKLLEQPIQHPYDPPKALNEARGNGTSMISRSKPPRDQISQAAKMVDNEYGTASNINSRVNRQSVLAATTSESDDKFGFIVMDGHGTLFGTLSGNTRKVLHKFTVDLPKKHARGGQDAPRLARLRVEKRRNYLQETAELATQFFINPATSQPNVSGLILAGSADFKNELSQSHMFDQRLQAKILKMVDVSYGGERGFYQAIQISAKVLSNVNFTREQKLIGKYFEEISQDTGKYVFGVEDTMTALEMGAVETLILSENLDVNRYVLKNSVTGATLIKHLNVEQEADQSNFLDKKTSAELEAVEKTLLREWFAENYRQFGCALEFITKMSLERSQFSEGFGGIGGILRYKADVNAYDDVAYEDFEQQSIETSLNPVRQEPVPAPTALGHTRDIQKIIEEKIRREDLENMTVIR